MKLTAAICAALLLASGAEGATQSRKLSQMYAKTKQIPTASEDPVQDGINYISAAGQVENYKPWPYASWPNLQGKGPNAFHGPEVMDDNVGTEVAQIQAQQNQQQKQETQQIVQQEQQLNQQQQRTQQQVHSRQNTQQAKKNQG